MTQAGYSGNGRKGCGQLWDAVSSDYAGLPEMFVKPDDGSYILYKNLIGLPVFAYFETDSIGLYGGKEREHTDG
jgi:hypothetical protein